MKIKKSQAALGLAALIAVSTIGMASATLAAGKTSGTNRTATSTAEHLGRGNKVTLTAAQKAEMETKKAEMEAKKTAEEAALKANDYNAWVTAVGTNAPILKKVTATNFSRYVELYNLRQQEKTIATELGLVGGEGRGMGRGGDFGHGQE